MTAGKRSFSLQQSFALVFFSMLAMMLVFELVKQVLAPSITIWESHAVTIIFTSIIAILIVYFPLRSAYREKENAKTAESDLRESEKMFRGVAERSSDLIMLTDNRGKAVYVAPSVKGILGFDPEEVTGRGPEDFLHPDDLNTIDAFFRSISEGQPLESIPGLRVRKKDRIYAILEFSGAPILKDGVVSGIQIIGRDITERTRAEEALRESRQILEAILNSIPVRIFWKDKNLIYLGCNTAFARDAGFEKPEDIIGRDDYSMGWREQAELYRADDQAVIESGKSKTLFEEPQTTPSGEIIYLLTSKVPLRDKKGEIIGVLGTYLDITARRRAEEALKESEYRFRELFNSMSSGVAVYRAVDDGADFVFVDFNHGAENIDNISRQEVIGKRLGEVFPGVQEFGLLEVFQRVWRTGKPEHFPVSRYRDERIAGWRENFVYRLPSGEIVTIYDDITERKRAEEALRASEERYRGLTEASPDQIFIIGRDDTMKYANTAALKMFHLPAGEVIGRSRKDLFPPDIANEQGIDIRKVFNTGEKVRKEESIRFGGQEFWIDTNLVPLKDEAGHINAVLGIARDITTRKRAEEEMKQSFERFKTVMDSIDALVYVTDMQTFEILFLNKYGKDVWGEVEGKVCWMTIQSGQTGPCPFCTNDRLVDANGLPAGTYSWEFRNTVNGRWYDCRDSAIRWLDGRIVRLEIATDITDRKRVEEALRASEQRSEKLLEALPDMMFVISREGVYLDFSVPDPAALAVPPDRIIGMNVRDSGFGEETTNRILHFISLALETKQLQRFEYELTLPWGTRQYEARVVALSNDEALGIVRDITDRLRVEEALHQANKKLNILSSITRHDILNLIMAIRGYLELSEDLITNPELLGYLARENEAVNAIQRQIEFTRYYQDIGVEEPKWQDVREIVGRVSQQLDLTGIVLENLLPELEVFADPLIEKVFYNLIENSLRHGEHVTTIGFSSAETDSGLVISYRDNGVGISKEDKKKLFQRGFGKHTGLGLFLSREILSITGITIQENGEPGNGVHFEIVVPGGSYRFIT
jgi:PAS domain S-box-containing protein